MAISNYLKETALVLLSLAVIYLSSFASIDASAKKKIDDSFSQALGVFATAKALNAVISVVQGTEVGPPGVTITIGEVVDPINDLVERFSWVMLASLSSLGIQKILFNIVTCKGFDIFLISLLVIFNIIFIFRKTKFQKVWIPLFKIVILVVFIRFSMPLMAFANDFVYNNFVKNEYSVTKSESTLNSTKEKIGSLDDEKASFFSSSYYTKKLERFKTLVSKASDNIVDLIIVFVFQTMLFPLIFLFALYKLAGRLLSFK